MNLIDKALAALAGLLAILLCVVFFINAGLRVSLAQSQSRETACRLSNSEMAEAMTRQNAAIEKMRAPLPPSPESIKHLQAAARIEQTRPGSNACAAAEKLLNQALTP